MTDFKIPTRYDKDVAQEGVWFVIEDENGNDYGSFKCKLIDNLSPVAELERKRVIQKYKLADQRAAKKMTEEDRLRIVLCEMSLVDWEMQDAKGKSIPFSTEKAMEYFEHEGTKFVFVRLLELACDVRQFAATEQLQVEAEEAEKN